MRFSAVLLFLLFAACSSEPEERPSPSDSGQSGQNDGGQGDSGQEISDAGMTTDAGTVTASIAGLDLLERLAGLWTGPATRTPLGDFRMMNVDFANASEQFVFGRVDLDAENALRFGYSVETHGGADVLTYRNGGYFLGLLRDDRTKLMEHNATEGTYRFCHVERGCEHIDAVYDFDGDDRLIFDVFVRGAQHVYWDARRVEVGTLPASFTERLVTQGEGTAPFPDMPSLRVTVTFAALAAETPVWIVLSREECSLAGGCDVARTLKTIAPAGATSAELNVQQLHAAEYQAIAVVDRNANLEMVARPDSGDGVSLPNTPVIVAPNGESTLALRIIIDVP